MYLFLMKNRNQSTQQNAINICEINYIANNRLCVKCITVYELYCFLHVKRLR